MLTRLLSCTVLVAVACSPVLAEDAASVIDEPGMDAPTLRSLGFYWSIAGDGNRNARVELSYRRKGDAEWKLGAPLHRVVQIEPKGAPQKNARPTFAGSILLLDPGVTYDVRLQLRDPDGGDVEKILSATTLTEPKLQAEHRLRHVSPGDGGGIGTSDDPFRGLTAAQSAAEPGDVFVLAAGTYRGEFIVNVSGEPGKPIVWRGPDSGEAIIDGGGEVWRGVGKGYGGKRDETKDTRALTAIDVHDVWFENLSIQNATRTVVANRSKSIVIRRCRLRNMNYAIVANGKPDALNGFFITDNIIEGPSAEPAPEGPWDARGIEIGGTGHVIAWNRIRGFSDDCIATAPGAIAGIDIHNNDLGRTTEGIELDHLERNARCFHNRIAHAYHGISEQPVVGGPVYVFRNVMYGLGGAAFKLHGDPSGVLMFHNTSVRKGSALVLWTPAEVHNCWSRNNLYAGSEGRTAYDCSAAMINCDFDYDAFVGGPWTSFLKWGKTRYATLEEAQAATGLFKHSLVLKDNVFAAGTTVPADKISADTPVDFALRPDAGVVDAGEPLPGLNDGFAGTGPDIGAIELGEAPPHYGPRAVLP